MPDRDAELWERTIGLKLLVSPGLGADRGTQNDRKRPVSCSHSIQA
jgi:hypothetical protein